MGVSSISSVAESYSQNAKTLDEYYAALDKDEFPVIRGITLNEDDVIRREVIQQLACHFQLNFADIAKQFNLNFADYFAQELSDLVNMAKDGLLSLDADGLVVTPRGRFLIRNICMVFDVSLRAANTQTRFSKVI
jgi:oxygen-independent coproporphyrinogen-3 oxidase